MTCVGSVLIVGAGPVGCSLAALLARAGVGVDVVEIKPEITALGSGITLQGNALRVLREVGVWDEVRTRGFGFDTLGLRKPDGTLYFEQQDARTGGPDLPATLGMERPRLQAVLAGAATDAGARIRTSTTVEEIDQDAAGVRVRFDDATTGTYDLVVGADGVRSTVRSLLGIDVRPRPVGMGIWRIHTRRPETVTRTDLVYGGPCHIAGYCPTGPDTMYAYLVEEAQDRFHLTGERQCAEMRRLAAGYGGVWEEIRADMTDPERINYTWFETHLVERPWHRGRVVLVGDAAHSCPPTLAQGAAMGLEDASVLAELLTTRDTLDESLFTAFMDRRFDRARTVVEASVQLCEWQLASTPDADVPGLMGRIAAMVGEPA
ncbi:FAD-dependent oxidoreductase [Thermobifida halotolerans]|uniref:FAD-dependent oxidoreductase n=1 Tax=Thermobifida halotolerans TaxID=483545 RepID=A0A399FWZ2_9ACTN|nr:FAD-dependent oxidoreductase [Thermobifida halotolerans]UOE18818.1 FAD-dependent oxidoreductase [Thermobifida halotolerans]